MTAPGKAVRHPQSAHAALSSTIAFRDMVKRVCLSGTLNWPTVRRPTYGAEIPASVTWTSDRGYMVVSKDRAAALRAIGARDASSSLIRASRFQERIPAGGGVHDSGFLWLDTSRLGEVLESLGQEYAGLIGERDPVLVVVTGGEDEIRWTSRTRLTSLIFDLMLM